MEDVINNIERNMIAHLSFPGSYIPEPPLREWKQRIMDGKDLEVGEVECYCMLCTALGQYTVITKGFYDSVIRKCYKASLCTNPSMSPRESRQRHRSIRTRADHIKRVVGRNRTRHSDIHERFLALPFLHDNHYILYVIDAVKKRIEIYDSLGDAGHDLYSQVCKRLIWFLGEYEIVEEPMEPNPTVVTTRAHQANCHDCGPFVCLYALLRCRMFVSKKWIATNASKISMVHFRRHMVNVISGVLKSKTNKLQQ